MPLLTLLAAIKDCRLAGIHGQPTDEWDALVARGGGNTEIAAQLVLTPKTVRNHVSNFVSKLQVADRTQAALRAREAGLA